MRTPGRLLCRGGALVCSLVAFVPEASAAVDAPAPIVEEIQSLRRETWRWQRLMRVPLSPTRYHAERSRSEPFRRWVLVHWRREATRARRAALNPPRRAAWLCIHGHEGPWNARTGNGYYGGLQMDMAFQRRWGPDLLRRKGTADRWRPIEQIWVAERAYRSGLGFSPWPTARYCGI